MSRSSLFFVCWRDWDFFWSCQTSGEPSWRFSASTWAFLESRSKKTSELFELGEALAGLGLEFSEMLGQDQVIGAHGRLFKRLRIKKIAAAVKDKNEKTSPCRE